MDDRQLKHECGVFGAIGNAEWPQDSARIAQIVCTGLGALQHRGQESCGIASSQGTNHFHIFKGMGLVRHVFDDDNISKLQGSIAIGHTRYATSAESTILHSQPFMVNSMHGTLAIAHNGELVNKETLRKAVLSRGICLSTESDSELIITALCMIPPEGEVNGPNWPGRIRHLMQLAPLSYSLVLMLKDKIYAVRDPYGNRPLCLGQLLPEINDTKTDQANVNSVGWVVASESCAFIIDVVRFSREIRPGEILEMTSQGVRTLDVVARPDGDPLAFCIFEYIYFARPTSMFEGQEVYKVRTECGKQLALEHPIEADVVGSIPASGNAAATGYAQQSNIPYKEVLCRNEYIGRTFIQPTNGLRRKNVSMKFAAIGDNVKGKRIVLIDDSIVRGNTIGSIIQLLRKAGAAEVHVRVASPPLKYACYMGINIPTREELIANELDAKRLAEKVCADTLEYLSVEGLVKAVNKNRVGDEKVAHCTACLTGKYPVDISPALDW